MNTVQFEGNYFNKYQNNGRIINYIMNSYFKNFSHLIDSVEYSKVYEAGCGEGFISQYVYNKNKDTKEMLQVYASDISENVIKKARKAYPYIQFYVNSIYDIKENNNSFDLAIASEVLEHLDEPEKALSEVFRISKKYILISVPNEPIWCIANFARVKYIRRMGNTPGHINHYTKGEIIKLLYNYGNILEVRNPFPWTMVLCEKKY